MFAAVFGVCLLLICMLGFRLHALLSLLFATFATAFLTSTDQLHGFAEHSQWTVEETSRLLASTVSMRVANAFGETVGKIGLLILFAAVIGTSLHKSGAAERIVRAILSAIGEKKTDIALLVSSFTLAIPVFFDTVFYLLIPIVRSASIRQPAKYSLFLMCAIAGGVMAHSLVPPTPGPLLVAEALNVSFATMMFFGIVVGGFTVFVGYIYARWANRRWQLKMVDTFDTTLEELMKETDKPLSALPSLHLSLLPIVFPLSMIAAKSIIGSYELEPTAIAGQLLMTIRVLGDTTIALGISSIFSLALLYRRMGDSNRFVTEIQSSLTGASMVVLITGAGGAFGKILQQTDIAIQAGSLLDGMQLGILPLAFLITLLIRTAQGSATVAMVTAIGMLQGIVAIEQLGFHPVYLAIVIGCGSKIFPWMNDSAFWIVARMTGMSTVECIKHFSYLLSVMGVAGLFAVMLLAWLFPLVP